MFARRRFPWEAAFLCQICGLESSSKLRSVSIAEPLELVDGTRLAPEVTVNYSQLFVTLATFTSS